MTPGACSTPLRGPLSGRYIYLYAIDIDAVDVLAGKVSMCVDRGKFKIYGISDCWRRGLQAVNFAEIDTGGSAGLDDVSQRFAKVSGASATRPTLLRPRRPGGRRSEERLVALAHRLQIVGGKHLAEQAEEIAGRQRARAVEQIRRRARRLDAAQMRGDLLDQRESLRRAFRAGGASPGEKSSAGASSSAAPESRRRRSGPTNTRAFSAWRGASKRITS